MSSTRQNKQKGKVEKAERCKALLSPESLPVVYTDLRNKAAETKSLAEFLAWAREEKVLIFTQAYRDFLLSKASRTFGKVKILCPSIEKDCTSRNGIAEVAEAFYADRKTLFVDNMYTGIYKKALLLVIEREKALRAQNELIEEAACSESNKTVEAAVDCESSKLVDIASEYENVAQDADNEGEMIVKGSAKSEVDAQYVASEYENAAQDADNEGQMIVKGSAESEVDAQHAASVYENAAQDDDNEGQMIVKDSAESQADAQGQTDAYNEGDCTAFDGWLLQLEKGNYDQILIQLLKSSQATTVLLESMKESSQATAVLLESMKESMDSSFTALSKEVKSAHKAISDNGESIVRVSLAQYLQQKLGPCAKQISVPIFGRRLPFIYFQPLEDLARLCLTSDKKSRSLPEDVEIDVFVKVVEEDEKVKRQRVLTPPRAPHRVSDELASAYWFTSFIIGENTRSGVVCNTEYSHPVKADHSRHTKLLYKFIQVERALIAAKEYYYVDDGYMEAGLIVSPSFKNLSTACELIDQVLAGRVQAFRNIACLHAKEKMWLTSL